MDGETPPGLQGFWHRRSLRLRPALRKKSKNSGGERKAVIFYIKTAYRSQSLGSFTEDRFGLRKIKGMNRSTQAEPTNNC
ncbi:MAG: hypothetical protein R2747_16240 [Pyrinomonadaceae bacterium]